MILIQKPVHIKPALWAKMLIKFFLQWIAIKKTDEYCVANSALVPVLTKGMQEQQKQIELQNSEIKELIQNK